MDHYAEPVEYTVDNITSKNKDQMSLDLIVLLQGSSMKFLSSLFSGHATGKLRPSKDQPYAKYSRYSSIERYVFPSDFFYMIRHNWTASSVHSTPQVRLYHHSAMS